MAPCRDSLVHRGEKEFDPSISAPVLFLVHELGRTFTCQRGKEQLTSLVDGHDRLFFFYEQCDERISTFVKKTKSMDLQKHPFTARKRKCSFVKMSLDERWVRLQLSSSASTRFCLIRWISTMSHREMVDDDASLVDVWSIESILAVRIIVYLNLRNFFTSLLCQSNYSSAARRK